MRFERVSTAKDSVALPQRATTGSAGYDFYAPDDYKILPGDTMLIKTGIKCQIDDGWMLQIYPRSSMGFKYNVRLANTIGIIDSDYYNNPTNEGEICIKLYNPDRYLIDIKKGSAFAQGIFMRYGLTDDDVTTGERTGGMGSTDGVLGA